MTDSAPEHDQPHSQAPPAASEDIHLPGPTYLPIIVAAGITLSLVGILVSVLVFAFGMVVWIVATLMWVRAAREDIAELPLDHG